MGNRIEGHLTDPREGVYRAERQNLAAIVKVCFGGFGGNIQITPTARNDFIVKHTYYSVDAPKPTTDEEAEAFVVEQLA